MKVFQAAMALSAWIRAAVYAIATIGFVGVLHAVSHGFVYGQALLLEKFQTTAYAAASSIAHSYGFVSASDSPKSEATPYPVEPVNYQALCTMEAVRQDVNPTFACSNMVIESDEDPLAVSPKGAIGLMQVKPVNWQGCAIECGLGGPADLIDPKKNICCGIWWLNYELKQHGDDPIKAIEAYNGGPTAVKVIRKCGDSNKECLGGYVESVNHRNKVLRRAVRTIG